MRGLVLVSCFVVASSLACSGTDSTLTDDGGGNDSGQQSDAPNPSDGGGDVAQAGCDGGLLSCGGQCVDTQSDPQNCGGCGVVCTTQCSSGVCALFGSDAGAPTQVADFACLTVDATNVYWGTGLGPTSGGGVWKVPVNGGAPTLLAGNQDRPHGMASDGAYLYYANFGSTAGTGTIEKIAIGGNTPLPIASAQASPLDVAVDANDVYWTNTGDGSIWKASKAGSSIPVKLAGPNGQGHAAYLRVDANNVYWTDPTTGVVNRVPIGGGNTVGLTTTQIPNPRHLAIDTQSAYFSSSSNTGAAILSIGLGASGGSPPQILPNQKSVAGIETDGTSVWFAVPTSVQPYQAGSGEIHRMTVTGTNDTVLASKQNGPGCIAVDATSVYWINEGSGMISKTGK